MRTHLIFDLGGTLLFDPFDDVLAELGGPQLRHHLDEALDAGSLNDFLDRWRTENREYNFPFASHFLQEEAWIARASWPFYRSGAIPDKGGFPLWTTKILRTYRAKAFELIGRQDHLPELRRTLSLARARNYQLSVASNDRYFATPAMLDAARILDLFDLVVTSEELSFDSPGAEKPSSAFFTALQTRANLTFEGSNTFYIGDDETRDIVATKGLPLRSIRFFGNKSRSKSWLDNRNTTVADFKFEEYSELYELVSTGVLEN